METLCALHGRDTGLNTAIIMIHTAPIFIGVAVEVEYVAARNHGRNPVNHGGLLPDIIGVYKPDNNS